MADLDIRLFAGLEVARASGGALKFPTRKSRALLAVLSRHPGKRHGREALAALLWPESAEAQARANLRQTLNRHSPDNLQTHGDCTQIASPPEWFFLRNGLTARFW